MDTAPLPLRIVAADRPPMLDIQWPASPGAAPLYSGFLADLLPALLAAAGLGNTTYTISPLPVRVLR